MTKFLALFSMACLCLFLAACKADSASFGGESSTGQGGSMARFAALEDYLYVVDRTNLQVFEVSDPTNPELITSIEVGFGIETIFPSGNYLFLGSETGMHTYDISNRRNPQPVSSYEHVQSCDPVVVNDSMAFITLRSGNECRWNNAVNELQILSIRNISNPQLLNSYPLQNPHGLGIAGNLLFVCDGQYGLHTFDISQAPNITLLSTQEGHFYDVIPRNGELIAVGPSFVYQYEYSPTGLLELRSRIEILP